MKVNLIAIQIALTILILLYFPLTFAATYESTTHLSTIAKEFVTNTIKLAQDESIDVAVNQSDIPLQLTTCGKEITAAFPKNTTQDQATAIELTCTGDQAWHIFVPVNISVKTKVIIARRSISDKQIIGDDDLEFSDADKTRLFSGYFKTKEEVIGLEANQLILPGAIMTKRNLQPPILIHRNAEVDVVAKKNTITITTKAIAKTDGRLNESVKVYNPSSQRTIEAMVVGLNKAEIDL